MICSSSISIMLRSIPYPLDRNLRRRSDSKQECRSRVCAVPCMLSTERDSLCKVCTFVEIELHPGFIEHFASCGVLLNFRLHQLLKQRWTIPKTFTWLSNDLCLLPADFNILSRKACYPFGQHHESQPLLFWACAGYSFLYLKFFDGVIYSLSPLLFSM